MLKSKVGSRARYSAVVLAALAMVACGGGGGGDDDDDGPPGTVDITAANKDTLARAAVIAIQGGAVFDSAGILRSDSSANSLGRETPLALSGSSAGVAAASPLVWVRAAAVRWLLDTTRVAGRESPLADVSADFCPDGGSATLTDADGDGQPSLGEAVTVQFSACADGDDRLNGVLAITIDSATQSPLGFVATASMSDLEASSATSGRKATYNGGFTLTYSEPTVTTATTTMRVGSSLATQMLHPQYSDTVTLRAGYELNLRYDAMTAQTTVRASGDIGSATVGGTVELSTSEDIVQDDSELHPHAGRVSLLGKNGSLVLTALSNAQVRIDFDQGDGGTYEDSDIVGWDFFL